MVGELQAKQKSFVQILAKIAAGRAKNGIQPPKLRVVREAAKRLTYRRGAVETRGRKKALSHTNVQKLYNTRKFLITKYKGEKEVHWSEVIKKAKGAPHPMMEVYSPPRIADLARKVRSTYVLRYAAGLLGVQ